MAIDLPTEGNYKGTLDVHFIHERSNRSDATPLLMLHGWLSTSQERKDVILSLVRPETATDPAFHIIAPNLPGYGFSSTPTAPGMGCNEHTVLFANLMAALNYFSYAFYSTDLGFYIAQQLVRKYEDRILNHVTDFYLVSPNSTNIARYIANQTTPEESAYIAALNAGSANHLSYSAVHREASLSVAHALNNSPVGFLAWMYEVVYRDSDQKYTYEELITQAMLLWIPGVYGNTRSYREIEGSVGDWNKTKLPTSVLQFGGIDGYNDTEAFSYVVSFLLPVYLCTFSLLCTHTDNCVNKQPLSWVERTAKVTYFKRHTSGAHFPAVSQPNLVIANLRAIFSSR